ncbi:hypothetical protein [Arthrobacter sp.]|nr:hypothetical protein [Arthrobacter sp.]MDO5753317.1 hypothetical protein [Arthrobacter sp.]
MSTINTLPGREITDDELADFHGALCETILFFDDDGNLIGVIVIHDGSC